MSKQIFQAVRGAGICIRLLRLFHLKLEKAKHALAESGNKDIHG